MKEYYLYEGFIGGKSIKIDLDRYEAIDSSRIIVSAIWDTEEAFSLLANSFIEFEEYLLRESLELFFQRRLQKDSNSYFDEARQAMNLKLVSVLTASRMYEEQVRRRASTISKISGKKLNVSEFFSKEYDGNLEYRVMYELRNHSLHNQLPIRAISYSTVSQSSSGKPKDGSPSRHRVSIIPKIEVEAFCASDKVKSVVRKEVAELGFRNLDVRFFSRGFLACVSRCHESFRKATEETLSAALAVMKSAADELEAAKGEKPRHTSIRTSIAGKMVESHYIEYSNRSRIQELRKYWTGLNWTQLGYVSSEIVQSKDTYPSDHPDLWIPK